MVHSIKKGARRGEAIKVLRLGQAARSGAFIASPLLATTAMRYARTMELEGENGLFMKIVRREVPAEIVYEDEHTLAFLDISPTAPGHTLVVPKKPFRNIFDVDEEAFLAVMRTVRKIAPAVRDAVGAKGIQINSNHEQAGGQVIFHLHMHLIPRHDRGEFEFWPTGTYQEGEAEEIAKKIRALT